MHISKIAGFLFGCLLLVHCTSQPQATHKTQTEILSQKVEIRAVNEDVIPTAKKSILIKGALLIDGLGGEPLNNTSILVEDGLITEVGEEGSFAVPDMAEVVEAEGRALLPGLLDAHYHQGNIELITKFLSHGVTSIRDPGAWEYRYKEIRSAGRVIPRLFLTGPHLDMFPPAYPKNCVIVRDAEEARARVADFVADGASAIKVYYRLTPEIIRAICEEADKYGIPTTAHLEITTATDAMAAGIDGIEHVTSFGIDLIPLPEAEAYRQSVMADNNARRDGRYDVWSKIDMNSAQTDTLISKIVKSGTVISPTLAIFEYQLDEEHTDSTKAKGFQNMLAFVGKAKKAGASVVAGSHTYVPYAEFGWAYQRELELLAQSGLSNTEVIQAATIENARFFRIEDRLGSIEQGKQADLILVNGNPLNDIKAMYKVERVMLNGTWVPPLGEEDME